MKLKETKLGLISILAICGPLVEEHSAVLKNKMNQYLESDELRVLIDLKEVPFIDSSGLELLWDTLMEFRKLGGSLKLVSATPLVLDILLATRMSNIFEIFSDQQKAYRSFL